MCAPGTWLPTRKFGKQLVPRKIPIADRSAQDLDNVTGPSCKQSLVSSRVGEGGQVTRRVLGAKNSTLEGVPLVSSLGDRSSLCRDVSAVPGGRVLGYK